MNDIDVRDAVMIPATLILSGTPNPQAIRTIVSTQKALCSWVFTGAMKIDHKCYLNGVVRIGAVQSSCPSTPLHIECVFQVGTLGVGETVQKI